jgi:hypothetical protein
LVVASSRYYREQAKLLFSLALVTSDEQQAGQLERQAQEFVVRAASLSREEIDLGGLLDDYNEAQLRKS